MSNSALRTAAAFSVALVVGLAVFMLARSSEIRNESDWRARIEAIGPERAYAEFGTAVASENEGVQHGKAHDFGSALYSERGTNSFAVCNGRFQYGCEHGFIGAALTSQGEAVLPELAARCAQTLEPTSCLHGVGHGLIASYGYTDSAISRAVNTCIQDLQSTDLGGCIGGAVMEFDLKTMSTSSSATMRELTATARNRPCASLPTQAKDACYYWQVRWWYESLSHGQRAILDVFNTLRTYCAEIPDTAHNAACYKGIGNMAAYASGYSANKAYAYCGSKNQIVSDHCNVLAAYIMARDSRYRSEAGALCAMLTPGAQKRCRHAIQLAP